MVGPYNLIIILVLADKQYILLKKLIPRLNN